MAITIQTGHTSHVNKPLLCIHPKIKRDESVQLIISVGLDTHALVQRGQPGDRCWAVGRDTLAYHYFSTLITGWRSESKLQTQLVSLFRSGITVDGHALNGTPSGGRGPVWFSSKSARLEFVMKTQHFTVLPAA